MATLLVVAIEYIYHDCIRQSLWEQETNTAYTYNVMPRPYPEMLSNLVDFLIDVRTLVNSISSALNGHPSDVEYSSSRKRKQLTFQGETIDISPKHRKIYATDDTFFHTCCKLAIN